jgi:hypothetical protein
MKRSCCLLLTLTFFIFITLSQSTPTSHNVGVSSLDMFQNSWSTYKSVITADHMEHKSLTEKISQVLYSWIESKKDLSIADLGCGDLALLAPLYRTLPLKRFTAVDMSKPALELAQEAFYGDSTCDADGNTNPNPHTSPNLTSTSTPTPTPNRNHNTNTKSNPNPNNY